VSTIDNHTDIWLLSKCTSVQISNITKVCVQNVIRVFECKLEDVDATAWSLHRWIPGGNHPTLRSGVTSAGRSRMRDASGCDASPTSTWFRSWLLAGHRAEAMKSSVLEVNSCTVSRPVDRSVVLLINKEVPRQVANGWQKLLMKQDISIILAVHLCTLINEEQVARPQTAHSNRHHHRSRERRTGSHNTASLPDKWLQ